MLKASRFLARNGRRRFIGCAPIIGKDHSVPGSSIEHVPHGLQFFVNATMDILSQAPGQPDEDRHSILSNLRHQPDPAQGRSSFFAVVASQATALEMKTKTDESEIPMTFRRLCVRRTTRRRAIDFDSCCDFVNFTTPKRWLAGFFINRTRPGAPWAQRLQYQQTDRRNWRNVQRGETGKLKLYKHKITEKQNTNL